MRRPIDAQYAKRLFGSIALRLFSKNLCHSSDTCFHRRAGKYAPFITILVPVLFMASPSLAQDLEWAKRAGADLLTFDRGVGIAVDTSGNSHVTGAFAGSAVFGAGEANETTLTTESTKVKDIFIAKYDKHGLLVWAKQAGGTDLDEGAGIAVDTSGNSYVTGAFVGSAVFGAGEANETTLVSAGDFDMFLAKYDSGGSLVWVKRAGGTGFDLGARIALDSAGNMYVTGEFTGSATFGAEEANETMVVSAGSLDFFVAKYDAGGSLVWVKRAGGTGTDRGIAIAVDVAGNNYVTGSFHGSASFAAEETGETTLISAGSEDLFIAKFDAGGSLVWVRGVGGTSVDIGNGIGVDASGNSYVTGTFAGAVTFGAQETNETTLVTNGGTEIFVAKYDSDGLLVWAKQAGPDRGFAIAVDASGNSYVTGIIAGSSTFGAGETNETTLVSAGSHDIFIAKYDVNGMLVWARRAGGTNVDIGNDIAVDSLGNGYVTGEFNGSATFGAGEANETTLISAGRHDIFVAKFDNNAVIVVNSTADSGPGSLRSGIVAANGSLASNVITFDPLVFPPPPGLPGIIQLLTPLPVLTGAGDVINSGGAGVVIDGSALAGPDPRTGLTIRAPNVAIAGLQIQNFFDDGIRVDAQASAQVTGVLLDQNRFIGNGRGIRVAGATTVSSRSVGAAITNNTVTNSRLNGISVIGNLQDGGNHRVEVLIHSNTVRRSNKAGDDPTIAGDGIQIIGGVNAGFNNLVIATVYNNDVVENRDDGIVVIGCGVQASGSNNTVLATITNNRVRKNGLDSDLPTNHGIAVSGASGEAGTASACFGNEIEFVISNNESAGNKTSNIQVSGGTGSSHLVHGIIAGNAAKSSIEGPGITVTGGSGTDNAVANIRIVGNDASGNFSDGIRISGGSGNGAIIDGIEVVTNTASRNGSNGVLVIGGAGNNANLNNMNLDGNDTSRNSNHGIEVMLGSGNGNNISMAGITNNVSDANGRDGIGVRAGIPGSGATPISGNRASRNKEDGIQMDSTGYILQSNTTDRNGGAGLTAIGNTNGGGNSGRGNGSCNTPGCF